MKYEWSGGIKSHPISSQTIVNHRKILFSIYFRYAPLPMHGEICIMGIIRLTDATRQITAMSIDVGLTGRTRSPQSVTAGFDRYGTARFGRDQGST